MHDGRRSGALCLILTGLFFPAQMAAQIASPGYNIFLYDISVLGISACGTFAAATSGNTDPVCSPLHLVFNVGIILHGLLSVAGIWLTRHYWPQGKLASSALLLLALGGVGAMMVGAYPLDDHLTLHVLGAVIAIAAPGLGLLLMGAPLRQVHPQLALWSTFGGLLILLAGLGHALGGVPLGRGTMERLAVWPQTLWLVSAGLALLGNEMHTRSGFAQPVATAH